MSEKAAETVEIRPGVFEPISKGLAEQAGDNHQYAGFMHSLGAAIGGRKVDNQFLKAAGDKD
ncbi:hypothetical protein A3709_19340 [Halioglobus sp. HI00S01]|uniref:hypothetical protein n=1 Tax=Halioglobus sp. HI00S01 TaxID=1822214 RepID=UPI0007C2DFC5|nr:hypothetical protein [Halioglobus sp. HI00S01]KZX57779.1 hypothetical protein A3709_19340 [Halioglobus sp. HI00S01]